MKIDFIPISKEAELIVPMPRPAKECLPKWYTSSNRFSGKTNKPSIKNGMVENNGIKACYPFYDAMTAGYIQETWCDINIEFGDDGSFEYNYAHTPKIIEHRNSVNIPVPSNFWEAEMIWNIQWMPRVPRGWSVLFCQPMNRLDLPFYSMNAIVDSDSFHYSSAGLYPFFLKKESSSITIPAGTPMFQMIPIKREDWNSSFVRFNENESIKNIAKKQKYFIGGYKKLFYKKKNYK